MFGLFGRSSPEEPDASPPASDDQSGESDAEFETFSEDSSETGPYTSEAAAFRRAAEAKRLEAEQAEAERVAAEQAEAERVAAEAAAFREAAEAERLAAEQAEAERLAAEQAEAERLAAEQAEAERVAAEQAEAERLAAERAEAQRLAAEQAEAQRLAAEQAEAERLAAEQAKAVAESQRGVSAFQAAALAAGSRGKVAKTTGARSVSDSRSSVFANPLLVIGVEKTDTEVDVVLPAEEASTPVGVGEAVASQAAPDPNALTRTEFEAIKEKAVVYAHRGNWKSRDDGIQLSDLETIALRYLETKTPSDGIAWAGTLGDTVQKLVIPFEKFQEDIRPFPAVRSDSHVIRSFMSKEDTEPLYIRIEGWEGDDQSSTAVQYYKERCYGNVYKIEGFSLLSESFLKTKAEAMRLVRDVVKKAVGLDNNARERAKERASEIVRDATWTLASLRNPGATGAAASLFEAARDMMSIRSDLGRSWRSGPTVAMITRTASTSALDFINEELLRPGPTAATQRV